MFSWVLLEMFRRTSQSNRLWHTKQMDVNWLRKKLILKMGDNGKSDIFSIGSSTRWIRVVALSRQRQGNKDSSAFWMPWILWRVFHQSGVWRTLTQFEGLCFIDCASNNWTNASLILDARMTWINRQGFEDFKHRHKVISSGQILPEVVNEIRFW